MQAASVQAWTLHLTSKLRGDIVEAYIAKGLLLRSTVVCLCCVAMPCISIVCPCSVALSCMSSVCNCCVPRLFASVPCAISNISCRLTGLHSAICNLDPHLLSHNLCLLHRACLHARLTITPWASPRTPQPRWPRQSWPCNCFHSLSPATPATPLIAGNAAVQAELPQSPNIPVVLCEHCK